MLCARPFGRNKKIKFLKQIVEKKKNADLEKLVRRPIVRKPVLDFGLFGQIFDRFDFNFQTGQGEKGGQVGRVGRDDDQGEESPKIGQCTSGQGSGRGVMSRKPQVN